MYILVTGGAGYIGCHTVRALQQEGFKVVVLDNLVHGHKEIIEYTRKNLGKPYKYCDMNKPYEFNFKNEEKTSTIISFVPIWVISKFLYEISIIKPEFFKGFEPVMNNFFAFNNLQASMAFLVFILKVNRPKNLTSSPVSIATSASILFSMISFLFTTCPS